MRAENSSLCNWVNLSERSADFSRYLSENALLRTTSTAVAMYMLGAVCSCSMTSNFRLNLEKERFFSSFSKLFQKSPCNHTAVDSTSYLLSSSAYMIMCCPASAILFCTPTTHFMRLCSSAHISSLEDAHLRRMLATLW